MMTILNLFRKQKSSGTKIKKGFLSESIAVNPKEILWTQSIPQVKGGLLKNIYPVNFVNRNVFRHDDFQEKIVKNNIGSIEDFFCDMKKWILKEDEIERAKFELSNSKLLFGER